MKHSLLVFIFVSANAYEVLSDNHKYFTFDSNICFFTSMDTEVFLLWLTLFFCIYANTV